MAYFLNWFDKEKNQNDQNSQGAQPQLGNQESSFVDSSNDAKDSSGRKQGSSGQYTNLQNYLKANSDQGQALASNISGNIKNEYDTGNKMIADNTSAFNKKVSDNTLAGLDTAKDEASAITTAARTNSFNNKINDEQKNRFSAIGNAEYKGPTDWTAEDYYQPTQSQVKKVQDYSDLSSSDSGRYTLLDKMFNKGNYSRGEQKFDNLLLASDPNNNQLLQTTREQVKDIGDKFTNAGTAASNLASGVKTKTDEARNYARSNLDANKTARSTEVENEIANVKKDWSKEYDKYNNILSAYKGGNLTLTEEQINKLGLNNNSRIYNLLKDTPAANYLDLDTFDANKVVSKDAQSQLSDLDLLSLLVGGTATNKYQDASKAGTSDLSNNFKADRFGQAANIAQSAFDEYKKGNVSATGNDRELYNIKTGEFAGNPIYAGDEYVSQDYTTDQNINDFLNNNKQLNQSDISQQLANIYGLGYSREEKDARAAAFRNAKANADASVYQQIMDALADKGYDNQVRKFNYSK